MANEVLPSNLEVAFDVAPQEHAVKINRTAGRRINSAANDAFLKIAAAQKQAEDLLSFKRKDFKLANRSKTAKAILKTMISEMARASDILNLTHPTKNIVFSVTCVTDFHESWTQKERNSLVELMPASKSAQFFHERAFFDFLACTFGIAEQAIVDFYANNEFTGLTGDALRTKRYLTIEEGGNYVHANRLCLNELNVQVVERSIILDVTFTNAAESVVAYVNETSLNDRYQGTSVRNNDVELIFVDGTLLYELFTLAYVSVPLIKLAIAGSKAFKIADDEAVASLGDAYVLTNKIRRDRAVAKYFEKFKHDRANPLLTITEFINNECVGFHVFKSSFQNEVTNSYAELETIFSQRPGFTNKELLIQKRALAAFILGYAADYECSIEDAYPEFDTLEVGSDPGRYLATCRVPFLW